MQRKEFIKFLLTGGIAALVNILSRIFFSNFMDYKLAVIFAYITGMTTAFILSRKYVFARSGRSLKSEYTRFAVVNLFAVLQVWLISVLLAEHLFPYMEFNFYPELTAHIIGVIFPVFSSYYGHKFYSFRQ